ncbi:MAG: L,D-transpeptidase family protein [Anaerolineae bacterium]|nr:L,D-transpeptidase family protein [Anaerolineae bacterium]
MTGTSGASSTHPQRATRLFLGGLILALLAMLAGMAFFGVWVFLQRMSRLYSDVIYPNVYALGVPLGGLTPEEAAQALEPVAGQVNTGLLVLTDGEGRWSYAWSEAGMRVDATATAQAAYAVGRNQGMRAQLGIWLFNHDVAPRFTFDAAVARGLLEALSQSVSKPAVEPTLRLENGAVVIVPGVAGRVMDVSSTLVSLQAASGSLYRVEIPLIFSTIPPAEPDTTGVTTQVEALLSRTVNLFAYDVLSGEMLSWAMGRDVTVAWLRLAAGPDGKAVVDVNLYAIRDTLVAMAELLGDGRGFRYDEAAQQVLTTFDAGGGNLQVYLTHPERTYAVQSGDTLTSIAAKFGMPPGLVVEANAGIDDARLQVGQQVKLPSQDILTPYVPVPGKKVVINIDEQRMRVYENDALIYDWPVSTGIASSPTHRGVFQALEKHEMAYASQWDLQMPYFIAIYSAGGGVNNGIHELPISSNGVRLWAGNLGHPASFGCIILGIPDAQTLFSWIEIGVLVIIE